MKYIIQPVRLLLSQNVNIMDAIHDRIFKGYDKEILQYIELKYLHVEPSFETVIEDSVMMDEINNLMISVFLDDIDNDAYVEEVDGELFLYYVDFDGDPVWLGEAYEQGYPRIEDVEKFFLQFVDRNEKYIFESSC